MCVQRGSGGNGSSSNGAGSAEDRLPILSGARNNSDPASRGRGGGRMRSSNAQTRRSLDYGMQRALLAHTVDENVRPSASLRRQCVKKQGACFVLC